MNKSGGERTENIDMRRNKVTSTYRAVDDNDLINKKYLSLWRIANNTESIPDLSGNTGKSGFMVSASSEHTGFFAFYVFNSWKGDWKVNDKSNMFIQIKCPQLVRLYQSERKF